MSYKKPKKIVASNVIDLSAGLLSIENIRSIDIKSGVFWRSKIGSVAGSISNLSDVETMANTVTKETNYVESNEDNNMNETTLGKTYTRMYVLGNLLKQLFFECMSDNNVVLKLPSHVDIRSNQVPPLISHVLETWCFNLTKFFALNIKFSAVPDKLVSNKLISIKKIFYQVDDFGGVSTPSKFSGIIISSFTSEFSLNKAKALTISEEIFVNNDLKKVNSWSNQEVIVKEIPVDFPKLAIILVFFKFGGIVSVKMQLIGLWQKAVIKFDSVDAICLVASK
ncbi:hypothetical protein G9A89_009983 [Geosiphon pyriformis]|nr:hypothetical protein G9A89_009983 [Geosiphon pyriformis]